MRERQPPHDLRHGIRLGAVGAQELQPRGHGEEEVAHLDLRARVAACRARLADRAAFDVDRPGMLLVGVPRLDRQAAPRRRSRRAPRRGSRAWRCRRGRRREASRCSGWQTASARSARRMPAAVVGDADQALAAAGGHDLDPPRAGVERVLHELLHDARGPLHHLAGGDAVDHVVGEAANRHGARPRCEANPSRLSRKERRGKAGKPGL